jgi:hypothetical protein
MEFGISPWISRFQCVFGPKSVMRTGFSVLGERNLEIWTPPQKNEKLPARLDALMT